MKKLLSLVLICAMGFGMISCVESEESQSVRDVRDAKAEQLKALTNLYDAQAKAALLVAEAEAAYNAAMAAYQAEQTAQSKEKYALELESLIAKYEANLMQYKFNKANYEKQLMDKLAEIEKAAEAELIAIYTQYSDYSAKLNAANTNLIQTNVSLARVEAEIVTVKEAAEIAIAEQEEIIAEQEAIIATEEAKLALYKNHAYADMNADSLAVEVAKANLAWRDAKTAYENNEVKAETEAKNAAREANEEMTKSIQKMNFTKEGDFAENQANGLPSENGVIGYVSADYDNETNWLYGEHGQHGYMISYYVKEGVLDQYKNKLANENDPEENVENAEESLAKAEAALEAFQGFKADFEKASEARSAIYAFKRAYNNYNEVYETVAYNKELLKNAEEGEWVENAEELVEMTTAQLDTLNKVVLTEFTTEDYDEWKLVEWWDRSQDMINSMSAFRAALATQETKIEALETAEEALEALTDEATEAQVEAAETDVENAKKAVEDAVNAVKKAYDKVVFDAQVQLENRKENLKSQKDWVAQVEKNLANATENEKELRDAFAAAKAAVVTLDEMFKDGSEFAEFWKKNWIEYNKTIDNVAKRTDLRTIKLTDLLKDENNNNIPDQELDDAGVAQNYGLYVVDTDPVYYRDFVPENPITGETWNNTYCEEWKKISDDEYGYLPIAAEYDELLAFYTTKVAAAKDNLASKEGSLATAKEWKTNWDAKEKELRDFVAGLNEQIEEIQALHDAYYAAKDAKEKANDAVTELKGKLDAVSSLLALAKGEYYVEGKNVSGLISDAENAINTAELAIKSAESTIKTHEGKLDGTGSWASSVPYKEALIAQYKAQIENYTAEVELYTQLVKDAKAALDAAMSAQNAE